MVGGRVCLGGGRLLPPFPSPYARAPVELDVGESDAQGWVANGLLVSIG